MIMNKDIIKDFRVLNYRLAVIQRGGYETEIDIVELDGSRQGVVIKISKSQLFTKKTHFVNMYFTFYEAGIAVREWGKSKGIY